MIRVSVLALVLIAGCFTADLDPDKSGVFACNADADCPDGRTCINARCETDAPAVEIRNPEDEQRFDIAGAGVGEMREVAVSIAGTLELVDPATNDAHVSGEGHIVLFVDGAETMTITSGPFSAGISIGVQVANVAGPHRVAIVARRNDGLDYDNPEATFTRLFWVDDGTPLVGIKAPWPNAGFGLDPQSIDVRVTTINFSFEAPSPLGMNEPDRGHAHIYYDALFPACLSDAVCDAGYLSIAQMRDAPVPTQLPESAETETTLTAVLRNIDHSLFLFDPDDTGPMEPVPVVDQIRIVRQD